MSDKQYYPGSYYQPLFDYLNDQFGVLALESDMAVIITIVERLQHLHLSESAGVPAMRPEDHEQVEINIAAGMPDYEASFQSGYTAGHDAGFAKAKRENAGVKAAVWVKASEVEIVARKTYYVKWVKGQESLMGTGWFQRSDGTFFWNIVGYVPILPKEREHMFLLDETASPVQSGKEDAVAEIERRNKIIEENLKLNMRLNLPGISAQEQEQTWQEFKQRNNL